jgi:ABC-type Fe3+ transport system permease subunit
MIYSCHVNPKHVTVLYVGMLGIGLYYCWLEYTQQEQFAAHAYITPRPHFYTSEWHLLAGGRVLITVLICFIY